MVHGLLRVHDDGFLAADHGTRLELLPHSGPTAGTGTLRFEDDGDYLEGRNDFGIAELGTVVNQGLIIKSGGTGTSLVTGTYSQPAPGAVTVGSGTLLLPSGSSTPATVGGGAGYGSGRCLVPGQPGCQAQTFDADRQNVQFQVPTEDTTGASVVIQELTHHLVGCRHRLPGRGARHRPVGHCGGSCDPVAALRRTAPGRARLDLGQRVPSRERHRAVRRSPALPCQRRSAQRAGGLRGSAGARREQPQRGRCRGTRQLPPT